MGSDLGVRYLDLNGDGQTDFVQSSRLTPTDTRIGAWINTGTGWARNEGYAPPVIITHPESTILDMGVRFPDLNGDGLPDMVQSVFVTPQDIRQSAWLNTGKGWALAPNFTPPVIITHETFGGALTGSDLGARFLDLNGDGLTDVIQSAVVQYPQDVRISAWLNTGTGWVRSTSYTPPVQITSPAAVILDMGVRFPDLNGDGLPDIVQNVYATSQDIRQNAYLNTGTGWISAPNFAPPVRITHEKGGVLIGSDLGTRFLDLNGDGQPDLIQSTVIQYPQDVRISAWLNTGTGWKRSTSYTPPVQITSPAGVILDMGVRIVDLDGNGLPDLIQSVWASNADQRTSAWLNAAKKLPDYLTSITNGMGAKTTIDYELLSGKKIQIYTKEHNAKYPTQDIQIPLYVVYQTSSDTDRTKPGTGNNQHTTTYHYTGAKLNVLGWGFLGFHTIKTTDQTTGITAITTYSQNVENHTQGIPLSTKIYTGKGTLLTSIQNTTTTKSYGTGAINQSYYYPYISTQTKTSYSLTGKELGTKTTENTEDAYANPTKTKITQKDSTGTYTTTTTNTYKNDAQNWHLGELTKSEVTKTAPNDPAITRTSSYTYDAKTGMLSSATLEPKDPAESTTKTYTRDQYGNVTSTTITGQGIPPITTSVKYDPKGRFIIQQTNALNQSTYQTTDPRTGKPLTQTNANGQTTSYTYDGFGKKTSQTNPDGTKTTYQNNWYNKEGTSSQQKETLKYATYTKTTQTTDEPPTTKYYDKLNREIAKTTIGFNGKTKWTTVQYDDLGRETQKTQPYYEGDKTYSTTYNYDELGRTTKITYPNGQSTKYNYNGNTTTITNPLGQTTTKTTNIQGKIQKITDAEGNTITYNYDAYGNLTKLTGPDGNATTITYNTLGKKTSIKTPDIKKSWTYSYNVLGELTKQTDAKGNETTYTYDKLGRLTSRTDPAGTSTWQYDTSPHGIGKLATINGTSNNELQSQKNGLVSYKKTYSYDQLSRLKSTTTNINGQNYTKTIQYNKNGKILSITYPGDVKVQNHYNALGYLDKKTNEAGTTYWQLNSTNAEGQTTSYTGSNGLKTTKTYDPKTGFLTQIKTQIPQQLQTTLKLQSKLTGKKIQSQQNKT